MWKLPSGPWLVGYEGESRLGLYSEQRQGIPEGMQGIEPSSRLGIQVGAGGVRRLGFKGGPQRET